MLCWTAVVEVGVNHEDKVLNSSSKIMDTRNRMGSFYQWMSALTLKVSVCFKGVYT